MTTPRRWPAGLVGMLALVAVVERTIARRDGDLLTVNQWAYRIAGRDADRKAPGCEVLCFGDSLIKMGVLPRVIEHETGSRAWNLALSGSRPAEAYALLRRALAAGARPRAAVIGFWPTLQAKGPAETAQQWPFLIGPAGCVELAWQVRAPDLFARLIVDECLPTSRCRYELRGAIVGAFAGRDRSLSRWLNGLSAAHWRESGGAQVMRHAPITELDVIYSARTYYARWSLDPANARAVGAFLDLAASRGIAVYWLIPPIHPQLQEAAEASGVAAAYRAFIRSWQGRFPNLVVVDGGAARYDPATFLDGSHLAREGAYACSVDLAAFLRRPPPDRRWIELPAYRPRPMTIAVEDSVETNLRLTRGAAGVRR